MMINFGENEKHHAYLSATPENHKHSLKMSAYFLNYSLITIFFSIPGCCFTRHRKGPWAHFEGRWRSNDSRPIGFEGSRGKEHRLASRQKDSSQGQSSLWRSWQTRLTRQTSGSRQRQEIRTRPWSSCQPWIQKINTFSYVFLVKIWRITYLLFTQTPFLSFLFHFCQIQKHVVYLLEISRLGIAFEFDSPEFNVIVACRCSCRAE